MRDRFRHKVGPRYNHYLTDYYTGAHNDVEQVEPVIYLEYMADDVHDYKSLGKSDDNIGGPLIHNRVSLDLGGHQPLYSGYNGAKDGQHDLFIPNLLSGVSEPDSQHATSAFAMLQEAQAGIKKYGLLTESAVSDLFSTRLLDIHTLRDLDGLGATAVSLVAPTTPATDTATAVAELFAERGFFSRPGSSLDRPEGEWLNYQLGIAPTISQFQEMWDTYQDADTIIAQYERDAGRRVRRRYTPEPDVSVVSLPDINASCTMSGKSPLFMASVGGSWKATRTTTEKWWFSGAFTYSRPPEGWRRTLDDWDRLYGVVPGIDTVWESVPLSFVADYFVNAGDVFQNLNAFIFDGLVMPYGYVMYSLVREYEFSGTLAYYPSQWTVHYKPVTVRLKTEVHRRQLANPFGFGLTWESLNSRQWSILAALGISRLRS